MEEVESNAHPGIMSKVIPVKRESEENPSKGGNPTKNTKVKRSNGPYFHSANLSDNSMRNLMMYTWNIANAPIKATAIIAAKEINTCLIRSPTGGYAPGSIECPDKDLLRTADGLSSEESEWLESRNPITKERITEFLSDANLTDFDVDSFMNEVNDTIKIGIAFSGGGYRAMLNGAGQLLALDDRYDPSNEYGLGGILQSATYLVGLSGGNWLVGTVVLNNFSSVADIMNDDKIWDLEDSIINPDGWNVIKAAEYYTQIYSALDDKEDAGYDRSITDIWGRALSYQFFPDYEEAGVALCFSDIRNLSDFKSHNMPFPIVVADGRTPGSTIISGNSTIFEFNAFEVGSWDPSLYQFMDTKYLGTELKNGKPVDGTCVAGYDNAGFVIGTSSSLFNQFILQLSSANLPSLINGVIEKLLKSVSSDEDDIAIYEPNPFYKRDIGTISSISENETLFLVDGGEDLQNVPLQPLIQPVREVDVIFAYDNSADTDESWPNGTSLIYTYKRQFLDQGNGTLFPYVPDAASFRNLNLTSRPAFFGCDASNFSSLASEVGSSEQYPPLVVYTANRPMSYWSNTSTFKLSYELDEKLGVIQNGFEVATRGNLTLDEDFKTCIACAIIKRAQDRLNQEQTEQCKRCFETYCWDGAFVVFGLCVGVRKA
ncbi:hypothetical protein CANTEDRAFT_130637 [Yamadazyma tenuis ATCC 10573]|uniref:Lysophospholipase n=1 Tax=Candida tenuis (strain ATCC 10573 / BCRC 21748 / CBS 615 / JCM 9827 / NBRC 10315 / NRRL Y-1498 / VKM Y-70) TaxID=590646 RepID=G3B759_CANTC|nr:uncharacterized protein CANTEDRAFT_130637 [Yamadazyma tenuis ATCC 10573]EGV63107.1 hypothetical protein CANTEDRAFT_130637 [Yamadazyma tenuis ATCC 10573]